MSSEKDFDFSETVEYVKSALNGNLDGWKQYREKGSVKGYQRNFKDTGLVVYRGIGYIEEHENLNQQLIIDLLMSQDHDSRKKWDNNPPLTEFRMLEVFSKESQIAYLRYKSPSMLVYDRDCVACRTMYEEEEDSLVINPIISVLPDHPKGKKTVRCEIVIYCWVIKHEKSEKRFRIEYFSSVDLKGWIPKWIVNATAGAQPDNVALFIDEIKKVAKIE